MISMIAIHHTSRVDTVDIRDLTEPALRGKTIEEFLDTEVVQYRDMEMLPGSAARFMFRPFTGIDPHLLNLAATIIAGEVVIGDCLVAFVDDDEKFIDLGQPPDFLISMLDEGLKQARLWHEAMFSEPIIQQYYGGAM